MARFLSRIFPLNKDAGPYTPLLLISCAAHFVFAIIFRHVAWTYKIFILSQSTWTAAFFIWLLPYKDNY